MVVINMPKHMMNMNGASGRGAAAGAHAAAAAAARVVSTGRGEYSQMFFCHRTGRRGFSNGVRALLTVPDPRLPVCQQTPDGVPLGLCTLAAALCASGSSGGRHARGRGPEGPQPEVSN